jgi:hypothetical protein
MRGSSAQSESRQMDRDIRTAMGKALLADSDAALTKLKTVKSDVEYQALRNHFAQQVLRDLATNGKATELLEMNIADAVRRRDRNLIPALVKEYRQLYANALYQHRPKYLGAAGAQAKAQADATAAQLQQSSQLVAPTNGAAQPTPHVAATAAVQQQPGESDHDFLRRKIALRLRASSAYQSA